MRIGIDLGGTKIEIIGLDDAGVEIYRERVSTPRGSYEGTIQALVRLVAAAERATACRGTVGIGMPGAISPATGLVTPAGGRRSRPRPSGPSHE